MQSYTMSMFVGSIKYLDKSLLETSPLGEITSPLQKDQVPTSEIKDALKAYHKLVSPLKPWKCEIKKNLDFLNDLLVLVTMKQNVDTNLNTLIDLPNEDVCGATTSNLSKSKGARLTNNDE